MIAVFLFRFIFSSCCSSISFPRSTSIPHLIVLITAGNRLVFRRKGNPGTSRRSHKRELFHHTSVTSSGCLKTVNTPCLLSSKMLYSTQRPQSRLPHPSLLPPSSTTITRKALHEHQSIPFHQSQQLNPKYPPTFSTINVPCPRCPNQQPATPHVAVCPITFCCI